MRAYVRVRARAREGRGGDDWATRRVGGLTFDCLSCIVLPMHFTNPPPLPVAKFERFRVRIRKGWEGSGRLGTQIAPDVFEELQWSPVLWDGEIDPDFFKTAGLERYSGRATGHDRHPLVNPADFPSPYTVELANALNGLEQRVLKLETFVADLATQPCPEPMRGSSLKPEAQTSKTVDGS